MKVYYQSPMGDIEGLHGGLVGTQHPELTGDVSLLTGNITGIYGDVTGLHGDISRVWGCLTTFIRSSLPMDNFSGPIQLKPSRI